MGYWGESEDLQESFRKDPVDSRYQIFRSGDSLRRRADGMLEWLGRVDRRVKVRGFTVDIAYVEAALLRLALVSQAVVMPQKGGESLLVAYVVPRKPCTISDLYRALSQQLPDFAIPHRLVLLSQMPVKSNGKIDVSALPQPDNARPQLGGKFQPARTPFENRLTKIWTDILGLDAIGIHDPYLELGGNSLQAMRIAARVQDEFGVEIPLAELFAASTVAEMALVVVAALASEADASPIE